MRLLGRPDGVVGVAHHLHHQHVDTTRPPSSPPCAGTGRGRGPRSSCGTRPLRSPPATTGRMTEIEPPTGTRPVGSLPGELDGEAIDPLDVVTATEMVEQQRARRVRVGDDQLGAGVDVARAPRARCPARRCSPPRTTFRRPSPRLGAGSRCRCHRRSRPRRRRRSARAGRRSHRVTSSQRIAVAITRGRRRHARRPHRCVDRRSARLRSCRACRAASAG